MAVAVPAVLGALGVGTVVYKVRKGRPAPSPDKLATMSMRRSMNDYWRNRIPLSMTDQSTNRSDYQNFYHDYPRKFIDPVNHRPYWQVGDPGRPNGTIYNNPGLRQPPIWAADVPQMPMKRPARSKAARRKGTMPSY
jgi:hypothetical protein